MEDEVVAPDGGAARAAPRPAPLAPGTGHTLDISAHTSGAVRVIFSKQLGVLLNRHRIIFHNKQH